MIRVIEYKNKNGGKRVWVKEIPTRATDDPLELKDEIIFALADEVERLKTEVKQWNGSFKECNCRME